MDELTPSQYVILGLIARHGAMTPYELKARIEESVAHYWPIPHAQLYRDPPRLAELGLLLEEAEEHGRRRRVFHLTEAGREALGRWLADPTTAPPETRNPSLLKLTFADLASPVEIEALALTQAARHHGWRDEYRGLLAALDPSEPGNAARARLIRLGIQHEQGYIDFWEGLAREQG
ncbi:PadR family transcriptional regulator [Kitasatospora sp. NPDC058190]|uniref:PadR family transcriptional regulator n=1 Tax=Kitasatospora sp. NPDC058190 TaxID=3346371 RepID=UPI0036DE2C08